MGFQTSKWKKSDISGPKLLIFDFNYSIGHISEKGTEGENTTWMWIPFWVVKHNIVISHFIIFLFITTVVCVCMCVHVIFTQMGILCGSRYELVNAK